MRPVSVTCPAKVNLFLRVLAREDSGYHQIETLFQALELHDTLTLAPSEGDVSLRVTWEDAGEAAAPDGGGPAAGEEDPGAGEDNTVVRAARLFFERTGLSGGVSADLVKRIPAGTGLGGGSSNAAGALAGLNALYGSPLAPGELTALGGRIGADVPFFCAGDPTALAWGRGDRLLGLPSLPAAHVVVAVPRDRISTPEAYRRLSRDLILPLPAARIGVELGAGWAGVGRMQHNDFEAVALDRLRSLRPLLRALELAGAVVARMTGSGSAVFGVFEEADRVPAALEACRNVEGVERVVRTRTLSAGPLNRLDGLG